MPAGGRSGGFDGGEASKKDGPKKREVATGRNEDDEKAVVEERQ
jgi:hypothetical protein